MKLNGKQVINRIVERLDDTGIRAYDSNIVTALRQMSKYEIWMLITMGDVPKWHTDRIPALEQGDIVDDPDSPETNWLVDVAIPDEGQIVGIALPDNGYFHIQLRVHKERDA